MALKGENFNSRKARDDGILSTRGIPKKSTFKEKTWVNTSRTLYITNVPPGTTSETLEKLFRTLEGFVALRRVRSMCFVDFLEKQQATSAMWKVNGLKLDINHSGLLVSYDKDDEEDKGGWSVRKKEEEKRRRAEIEATRVVYRCSACNHFCLKLSRPLTDMPVRKTDQSRVLEYARDVVSLTCVKGGSKLLKREKGVEKQFRYKCELCDISIAYRPVPYEQETKYIYVFENAVQMSGSNKRNAPLETIVENSTAERSPLAEQIDEVVSAVDSKLHPEKLSTESILGPGNPTSLLNSVKDS